MTTLHALKYAPQDTFHIGYKKTETAGEVSEDRLYVSEEEYWNKYYNHPDFNYEWKNGYLEEKPVSDFKGSLVYQWFCDILRCYFSAFPVGKIVNLEIGFRLAFPGGISVRKPDMAIVLNNNPVTLSLTDCNFDGTFDMCIESLSYSEKKEIIRDTVEKKEEYSAGGVREYYILDARKIETAFYRLNKKGKYSKIKPVGKDIIRSEVLPGFQFRIKDLYRQPSLEKLTEDEVYQGYVLPFYQKVRQKAESERQRAEQVSLQLIAEHQRAEQVSLQLIAEHQRAEQAEQRAAMLADKLKQLGISAE